MQKAFSSGEGIFQQDFSFSTLSLFKKSEEIFI